MQKNLGSQFKRKPISGQLPPEAVDADARDHETPRGTPTCCLKARLTTKISGGK